jgi:hypothetical protein
MRLTFQNTFRGICFNAALTGLATLCSLQRPAAAAELALIADVQADVVVVNNGAADAIQQQFRGQFEPLLKVELSFINRACKLTDEQRLKLIKKSNDWLTKFIRDYAKQGGQPQMQGAWFGGGRQQVADPRESIQAGVEKLVKAELPKEQVDIYAEECKKRSEFGKSVSVDNLVARIDKELILSPEQREKLTQSLTEHWDKNWAPQLEMFMHGMDMWPNVPDQWIRPHLTAAQQVAWGRLNKNNNRHVFFGGMGVEGQVIDDIDLKEGQDKPKDAAKDKQAAAVSYEPTPAN